MFKGVLIHWMCLGEKLEKFPFSFQRPLATLLTSAILAFSRFTSDVYLKAFLDSDWVDLSVLGKLLISSFQNTKEIENRMIGSKVMALGSMLMHFYNFLDSHWKGNLIIFAMAVVPIHYDDQIKIRVLVPLGVNLGSTSGQTWWTSLSSSGLMWNHEKCHFGMILTDFDFQST